MKLVYFIKEVFVWFSLIPDYIWMNILIIIYTFILLLFLNFSEISYRIVGLLFQCIGTLTTIFQINNLLKFFNKSNPCMEWLRRFPCYNRSIKDSASKSEVNSTTLVSSESVKYSKIPITLEEQVETLRNEVNKNIIQINNRVSDMEETINKNKKQLEEGLKENKKELKESQTNDIHIPLIGIVYILIGTFLSTFSQELVELLN